MPQATERPQLFLITPPKLELSVLQATLRVGGISAVLIATGASEAERETAAASFVPVIQDAGVAAVVADFTRVAGRSKADGVHIASGPADLRAALDTFRPGRVVGAGGAATRHAAMEAGEAEPDYILFGNPHGDTHPEPHPKALELAEWWSDLMEIPAAVMAGHALRSVDTAKGTGAAFVAVQRAVWDYSEGPAEAVRVALRILKDGVENAA